jgi:hypothetical protein
MECSVAGTTTLDREWYFTNVFKIVLIIVNINKDENKSLISNQFSLKNDFPPLLGELFCGGKN